MVRTIPFGAGVVGLVCVLLAACYSPQVTHCPDVDCPTNEVCDNHGGCALPEQLAQCAGKDDGTLCGYSDLGGHHIDGACAGGVCLPIACGDGVLTSNEVCDDGNNTSGDGCSADCQSLETCGNAIVDAAKGEACDDGNTTDGDGCQHDCQLPRCGDGYKDTPLNEECDAGSANSTSPDAPCRPNCQLPRCGDGVKDPSLGEVCDDGNNKSGDGCSGDCKSSETCGNRIVDVFAGEQCDDGNTIGGDGCSADCKSIETCGNGVVDALLGEVCDDGNTVSGDGCSSDCRSLEVCGNHIVDTINEQCDLGSSNSNLADATCRTDCTLQRCGDTIIDPQHGEQCDDGMMNADVADACRTSCEKPRCGDKIKDTGEVCDDGNTTAGDGCSSDCRSLETCGNAIIDTIKGEQCDNGTMNANTPNATCRTDCKRQRCGDAIIDTSFGEICDLGASNSNAANATCRTNCAPQRCGDGVLDNLKGETCDDGNVVSGDGCSADCKSTEVCGNSIVDTAKGEQCDAGASNSNTANAPCRTSCLLPKCGDAIVDTARGENCDLGTSNSQAPNATCRTNCQPARCGDGIIDTARGEVCDDGNTTAGDGCSPDCKSTETCGNGVVDVVKGEQCDAGAANANTPNAPCRTNCTLPKCGDGVADTSLGEVCDLGTMNSNLANASCRTNCQPQRCGDGIFDNTKGEVCDDGNVVSGDGCSADCKSNETCGNGIIDISKGELCDNGGLNANTANATCRTNCQPQKCGDTIVDTAFGETCDLGASNSQLPNATCRTNCTQQRCGDGILDNTKGEVCDDGNNASGDGCSSDCKSTEVCGNGIVDTAKGEQCDDANAINTDQCHNNCTLPRCGDGILDFNEQCDAGAANSNAPNAACRTNCTPARCGDGITDTARGEMCDDANNVSGDGCSADCSSTEVCGNGVLDAINGEQCDDGNTRSRDGCSKCLLESAVALLPGGTPPARESELLVYDGGRQRVVMFGGWTPTGNLGDTWEWDGVSWTQMHPKHSPAPRFAVAAGYDAARHRIVMFGGYRVNYGDEAQDTWEYDGSDWTQVTTSTVPAGRAAACMAFDGNSGKMVMFGGALSTNGTSPVSETWSYDGASWTMLAPATVPSARSGCAMTWDAVDKVAVMFGGNGTDQHTYTWSGSNWTDKASTSGLPVGYLAAGIAFDANLGRVVGWGNSNTTTYEWNNTSWTAVTATAPSTTRSHVEMAYDAARKQVVLFGGATSTATPPAGVLGDTWLRAGQAWGQPAAFGEPPARTRAAASYDPLRRRVVLFGGDCGAGCELADTWEFDGRSWTSVGASTPPAARGGAVADYDTSARTVRLYGGDSGGTLFTDVYAYNGSSYALGASSGRASVKDATMSYDSTANGLVTFGGVLTSTAQVTNQTWAWTAAGGWAQKAPATSPTGRTDTATAYDPVRKRTVVFAGTSAGGTPTQDTWEWDGATWAQKATTSGAGARAGARLFYNPDAAVVGLFGSSGSQSGEDLWDWNGTAWRQHTLLGTAPVRNHTAVAYHAGVRGLLAFSGTDASNAITARTVLVQFVANGAAEACTSSQLDYDNDGKAGCLDDDCWSLCSPLCPPGVTCPAGAPRCGDGVCTPTFEDCNICPGDCGGCAGGKCGDFHCDAGETHTSCPTDC